MSAQHKVKCPLCSFVGSSHGSMVVHFGNFHHEQIRECPPPYLWFSDRDDTPPEAA